MSSILTIICVMTLSNSSLIFAAEIYQKNGNQDESDSINTINDLVVDNELHSKRTRRNAFGDYGIGVGYPYIGERVALPTYSTGYGYGGRYYYGGYANHRHSETFNRFRSAIIVK